MGLALLTDSARKRKAFERSARRRPRMETKTMKNNKLALILGTILLIVCGGILITGQTKNSNPQKNSNIGKQPQTGANDYRLSGPYTHKNLSIFLIHSKTTITRTRSFLTLQEALEQKKVTSFTKRRASTSWPLRISRMKMFTFNLATSLKAVSRIA